MSDTLETLLQKVDTLTNLVEQMLLAHRMRDEKKFNEAHDNAAKTGFEITKALQEDGGVIQRAADICPRCEGAGRYSDIIGLRFCLLCDGTGKRK